MLSQNMEKWISGNDVIHLVKDLQLSCVLKDLDFIEQRPIDLYYSLCGKLFNMLRESSEDRHDWFAIGRALDDVSYDLANGMDNDALFYSAVAFYMGGYPASSVMTARKIVNQDWHDSVWDSCLEFLSHNLTKNDLRSGQLLMWLESGKSLEINQAVQKAKYDTDIALKIGPDEWVANRIYLALIQKFSKTNIRAALPNGFSDKWNILIKSFINRKKPIWDLFPSQIEAINAGLLDDSETFSIQMPTGSGKTALTETLFYEHLFQAPNNKAVLLVPYRALAKELRGSIGKNLNSMGFPACAVYGGTVPTPDEARDLVNDARLIIATPEAFTGTIGMYPALFESVSLVVCDEGHLLDSGSRGIALEFLLARLKSRKRPPRIVFVSAIVPNIDEINDWLGGSVESVVRSDYQPTVTEFSVLAASDRRRNNVSLELYNRSFSRRVVDNFLTVDDFRYVKKETGRKNTFPHNSDSSIVVAAARKAMKLGSVAVFAAQKGGNSGITGLAKQLIKQLEVELPKLPIPYDFIEDPKRLSKVGDYLSREFGENWIGTRITRLGAVMHHGDLPQEVREVLEGLVSDQVVKIVLCTSTLAEGVNLPIRTILLYSVERRNGPGGSEVMRQRDIKNLIGRVGRAGSSTRGLVICGNKKVWSHVKNVAEDCQGESVKGALSHLLCMLVSRLSSFPDLNVTNELLENTWQLFPLVDGIDSALVDLISEEIGIDEFRRLASFVAQETFAARNASSDEVSLLVNLVSLRSERLIYIRNVCGIGWVKGAVKPRLNDILSKIVDGYDGWSTLLQPTDYEFVSYLSRKAFLIPGFESQIISVIPDRMKSDNLDLPRFIADIVFLWISGLPFCEVAGRLSLDIDLLLRLHKSIVEKFFADFVEQVICYARMLHEVGELEVSDIVLDFPSFLRFGVPVEEARSLLANGLRHRRAAVELGMDQVMRSRAVVDEVWSVAWNLLQDEDRWRDRLGAMVYERTVEDVERRIGR